MSLETTAIIQTVSNLVTAITAMVGLLFLSLQVRHAHKSVEQIEKNRTAELRPYLAVLLEMRAKDGEPSVFLTFTNFGRTAASNVRLQFDVERSWNYVKDPNYAFAAERGISTLVPGESRTYFLGRLVPGTRFAEIEAEPLLANLEYKSLAHDEEFSSRVTLSLNDGRYGVFR